MGQITSLFVRKVVGVIETDADKAALLHAVGVDPNEPVNPAQMVADDDYYTFFEGAAAVDRHATTLPLRAGASMRCDDYGAFGLAWKSATTLRESCARAERYARVLTNVSTYEVESRDEGAYMRLHRQGERRLGMRLSNEATIASVFSISKQVASKAFTPLAVYFKHDAPKSTVGHCEYFGCPVHFGTDRDALLISHDVMQTPNKLGDEAISTFFEAHLETELAKFDDDRALDHRVRIQISQSLSSGGPTVSQIAGRLGMSARTLQRRLGEQGCSFQSLVDEARRQLAERLLQQSEYSLAAVAFLTGFSEQSAFTRAFRRWAGQTPRSYRLQSQVRNP